jgi:hypothetical protein
MRFRIVIGEKSKSCVVVAAGAALYLIESALAESGASVMWGLGLLLAIHCVVILARFSSMVRQSTGEQNDRLVRAIILATLLTGLLVVVWIYASGKAFQISWQSYVNAIVIGGFSAAFHLVPFNKFKKKSAAGSEPNGLEGPAQKM